MDRMDQIAVFLEVARRESFRSAARALELSSTATSRAVATLEARLGVRLLQRTTRSVRLTSAGRDYLAQVEPAYETLLEADALVAERANRIEGRLRIGAGVTLCEEQLIPLVPAFFERYPGIELDFVVADRQVDLIAERLDCAVRVANLEDSSLVARRVASSSHVLCASPEYLAEYGTPRSVRQLATGRYVVDANQPPVWRLRRGSRVVEHKPTSRLSINSGQAVRRALLQSLGVAMCPKFIVGEDLRLGRLVRVLPHLEGPSVPISVLSPSRRFMPPKLRVWIEFLLELWSPTPPWEI